MLEAFATDVSDAMRTTAHQYKLLKQCPHQRQRFMALCSTTSMHRVKQVLLAIDSTKVPKCTCRACSDGKDITGGGSPGKDITGDEEQPILALEDWAPSPEKDQNEEEEEEEDEENEWSTGLSPLRRLKASPAMQVL